MRLLGSSGADRIQPLLGATLAPMATALSELMPPQAPERARGRPIYGPRMQVAMECISELSRSGLTRAASARLALICACHAHAATLTWTGAGGDGNVNNPANWSPAQAPATGDVLIFGGAASLAPQMNTALTLNSITFDHTSGAFVLGGTGIYTLGGGGITNNDTQTDTDDQQWHRAERQPNLECGGGRFGHRRGN